jgi:hypothetical protein
MPPVILKRHAPVPELLLRKRIIEQPNKNWAPSERAQTNLCG